MKRVGLCGDIFKAAPKGACWSLNRGHKKYELRMIPLQYGNGIMGIEMVYYINDLIRRIPQTVISSKIHIMGISFFELGGAQLGELMTSAQWGGAGSRSQINLAVAR